MMYLFYHIENDTADVITIVAMFTIVAKNHNRRNVNHNCRNLISHNCRNANHNCHNFFENLFVHVNINTWLKDGISLGFLKLNPTFHIIVAILPG